MLSIQKLLEWLSLPHSSNSSIRVKELCLSVISVLYISTIDNTVDIAFIYHQRFLLIVLGTQKTVILQILAPRFPPIYF